jgi:electron transfer flavoprotein alpha/beta subunit
MDNAASFAKNGALIQITTCGQEIARILCVIRQLLDAEEDVKVREDRCRMVVDTMDKSGIEEALGLRESIGSLEMVALAIGPAGVKRP